MIKIPTITLILCILCSITPLQLQANNREFNTFITAYCCVWSLATYINYKASKYIEKSAQDAVDLNITRGETLIGRINRVPFSKELFAKYFLTSCLITLFSDFFTSIIKKIICGSFTKELSTTARQNTIVFATYLASTLAMGIACSMGAREKGLPNTIINKNFFAGSAEGISGLLGSSTRLLIWGKIV